MNLWNNLLHRLSLLDVAYSPMGSYMGETSPATKAILLVVLVLFLAFVGYLIWKSIRRKDDDF